MIIKKRVYPSFCNFIKSAVYCNVVITSHHQPSADSVNKRTISIKRLGKVFIGCYPSTQNLVSVVTNCVS